MSASTALWDLQKDSGSITGRVFEVLAKQLQNPIKPQPPGGGNGGQAVDGTEQTFLKAAELFAKMNLSGAEKTNALAILQSFCEKSDRIFIRMLLLPGTMKLGLPREACIDVCITGLRQEEYYYRLQAAELLASVSERFRGEGIVPDSLINDENVGVRVYAVRFIGRKISVRILSCRF